MKLLELIFVLPARENIVIINREKLNVPLYVGNVEEFFWIGKEQDKDKEVCSVRFNKEKIILKLLWKNNFEERIN